MATDNPGRTLREWSAHWEDVKTFCCPHCGSTVKPPIESHDGCLGEWDDGLPPADLNPYVTLAHWYTCTHCKIKSPSHLQKVSPDEARREWETRWLPAWERWQVEIRDMVASLMREQTK